MLAIIFYYYLFVIMTGFDLVSGNLKSVYGISHRNDIISDTMVTQSFWFCLNGLLHIT